MTTESKNSSPEKQIIPDIRPGDTVKVYLKIDKGAKNKSKTKNQIFAGRVIAMKHGHEAGATITVRRESKGTGADVAIEKIIPLHSPIVSKIEIVERKKVRRAKLYYIRNLTKKIHLKKGKEIKEAKETNNNLEGNKNSDLGEKEENQGQDEGDKQNNQKEEHKDEQIKKGE